MAPSTNPFRYFDSSPEVIRTVLMMYVKYPLSLRNVEDQPAERGIDICYETVRLWWNRFGPMFSAEIRRKHVQLSPYVPRKGPKGEAAQPPMDRTTFTWSARRNGPWRTFLSVARGGSRDKNRPGKTSA